MGRSALLLFASVLLCSCEGCGERSAVSDAGPPGAASASPLPAASSAGPRSTVVTTGGKEALDALDGSIRTLAASPDGDVVSASERVSLLAKRFSITRRASDLEDMLRTSDTTLAKHPKDLVASLARVRTLIAARRLAEARTILAPHGEFGKASSPQETLLRLEAFNQSDEYDPPRSDGTDAAADRTVEEVIVEARTLGRMQKVDEANARFEEAERLATGPDPFVLADLYFEWAAMWEREGDLAQATRLYREAVTRVPLHVHAAVHLAALEPPKDAVLLLEPLDAPDADPDVLAALGIFRELVTDGAGKASLETAKKRYDELVAKFPEAYAEHAGWFWLSAGDEPKKALAAARIDLRNVRNADSYELMLAAAQAAGEKAEACETAQRAKAYLYPSRRLTEALRQVGDCPPSPAASTH